MLRSPGELCSVAKTADGVATPSATGHHFWPPLLAATSGLSGTGSRERRLAGRREMSKHDIGLCERVHDAARPRGSRHAISTARIGWIAPIACGS